MAHNIVNTGTIWGITSQVIPGAAGPGGNYLTGGPELAGRVKKVNTVIVTNISTTTDYEATVYNYILDINGTNTPVLIKLANNIVVPAKSSMVIVSSDNPVYIEEGGYLGCYSNVVSTLTFTASYEVLF